MPSLPQGPLLQQPIHEISLSIVNCYRLHKYRGGYPPPIYLFFIIRDNDFLTETIEISF